jgi:hypothetical protein
METEEYELNNDYDEWQCSVIADEIGDYLVKYGRINVRQTKSKFGTIRVYCSIGCYSFYQLFKPRHVYVTWPKWLYGLDLKYGSFIMKYLNKLIVPYHSFVYRRAYKKALEKYPELRSNILACPDFEELLKGL